jgi:hypothetical protein
MFVFSFRIVIISGNVYTRITVIDAMNKRMNNIVDIRWVRRSYSLINGGADGKMLKFRKYSLKFGHDPETCRELFATKNKYIKVSSSRNNDQLQEVTGS